MYMSEKAVETLRETFDDGKGTLFNLGQRRLRKEYLTSRELLSPKVTRWLISVPIHLSSETGFPTLCRSKDSNSVTTTNRSIRNRSF